MKKHELLKYAYDNYPKGTVARFGGKLPDHVSTGKFEITDLNHNNSLQVMSDNGLECFYADGEWAKIIPEKLASILDGKCAIQVNNEREFKLLMEHYENKGWNMSGSYGEITLRFPQIKFYDNSGNGYSNGESSINSAKERGYKVISFANSAKEIGITVRVFIMKSEDGVDLYEGDEVTLVWGKVKGLGKYISCQDIIKSTANYTSKIFSTKEAAEKWIDEQDKPKEIEVIAEDNIKGVLTLEGVTFDNVFSLHISASELEAIYKAYQSLQ